MKPCPRCNGNMLPVASAEKWRCVQCGYYIWPEFEPVPYLSIRSEGVHETERTLKTPAKVNA